MEGLAVVEPRRGSIKTWYSLATNQWASTDRVGAAARN